VEERYLSLHLSNTVSGRSDEVGKSSSQGQNNSHSHMRNNVNKYVGVTSSDGGCLVPSAHILR